MKEGEGRKRGGRSDCRRRCTQVEWLEGEFCENHHSELMVFQHKREEQERQFEDMRHA